MPFINPIKRPIWGWNLDFLNTQQGGRQRVFTEYARTSSFFFDSTVPGTHVIDPSTGYPSQGFTKLTIRHFCDEVWDAGNYTIDCAGS